jgi:hypothetical protein
MSTTFRFFLSFSFTIILILSLSACGGGEPEDDIAESAKPAHCHPPTFVGPNPKECY